MTSQQYHEWEAEKEAREDARQPVQEIVNKAIDDNRLVVTKRGVFKNLNVSPYEIVLKDRVLKFSSQTKKTKFETEMKIKQVQLERQLKKVFHNEYKVDSFDKMVHSMYCINYNKMKNK